MTISSGTLNCVVTVPNPTPSCALTFPTVGVKSVIASFVPADATYTASTSNSVSTTVHFSADLAVSKTDGVTTYRAGDLLVYTIMLSNLGPDAAPGAVLTDVVPATLTGATWTCVGTLGAVCPQASGTGNINATVATLPANGRLTYTLQANVVTPLPSSVVNTAQVSITGLFINDPVLSNQSATDTNLPDAVFRNGFEDALLITGDAGSEVLPL